ncbi:dihydroorotase [Tranquillimonas rosea]|uniref:Dihydroorotase n=1 Tax=Tranquillimonas rosea TaxID=641238 RepID=A0A1H9SJD8_9RHOB|nr:dihydroorotase [Tranquillimonas rosea]SER84359.1 dihydroorotase [Tranquillimonas rosea]
MTRAEIVIPRPDDMHLHLRDEAMLRAVTPASARNFGRAVIMPNLVPPVVSRADVSAYRARILAAVPDGTPFEPLMTMYLTEASDPDEIAAAHAAGEIVSMKLYPAGATTNSDSGVRDIDRVMPVLEKMAEIGLPLCVHGEVTDAEIDIFDREAVFVERVLAPLRRRLPELRVVMEHVTTADGIDYVRDSGGDIAATMTVQHLALNRNALLAGGIRPHNYCLPVLKRERHRLALRAAAMSGDPRFFLGTDSAPHPRHTKEAACGCAGCFTAPVALGILAQIFEQERALERLPDYVAGHGPDFYGLPTSTARTRLVRSEEPVDLPTRVSAEGMDVEVFDPGFDVHWRAEPLE